MDESTNFNGETLRRLREQRGLTIRELAEVAGVSKSTIVAVEHGGQPIARIRNALAKALRVDPEIMTQGLFQIGTFVVSRMAEYVWRPFYANMPTVPIDLDRIQREEERLRLGRLGFITRFERLGSHRLTGSSAAGPGLMEIWRRAETSYSHAGHEICTVLRGAVRVFVGEEVFELYEGDSATFVSSEPHNYEPAEPLGPKDLPPLAQYIKILPTSDHHHHKRSGK